MKLKQMLLCAIFAALLCIFAPLAIPVGAVPLTLLLFGVMLCALVLPWKLSSLSVLLFLLLSLCGLPVFSGGHSGLTALPGPTGGYIWSALLAVPLISLLSQNTPLARWPVVGSFLACIIGLPLIYLCGTLQFSLLAGRTFAESLGVCVLPFLLPDGIKALATSLLTVPIRKSLTQAAFLQ